MFKKILKKDLSRNKIIMVILFLFIMLAAMSAASAVNLILSLQGSVNSLFEKSKAPHFVQMYAGELNQDEITSFARNTDLVKDQQTSVLLNINSANLFFGDSGKSQSDSILENSFVVQNENFDYLLDRNNEVLQVNPGEIGVPIYYLKQNQLKTGDKITVAKGGFQMEFTIKDFVRDVQMNSSLVTSKRFLINEQDMHTLESHMGETEYLIEFLLTDLSKTSEFEALYQSSTLPQGGTAITYSLYQLLNSLSDGIIAAVIILISLLLMVISFVSLRFILLATIEEDFQEIGVMKAIGISSRQIRSLYQVKYLFVSAAACLGGYILSLLLGNVFTQNITLYMGKAAKTSLDLLLPIIGSIIVFLLVFCFCSIVLRKFKKISAVEALRDGASSEKKKKKRGLRLSRNRRTDVNLFLGWNELFIKMRTYGLLCFVFIICTFLIVVPVSFLNTMKAPEFITYMGAGQSDVRIDLNAAQNSENQFMDLSGQLAQDSDISNYSSFATSAYKTTNEDGETETIKIENGNFKTFPLKYVSGRAPQTEDEIALSSMNAKELNKKDGDTITISSDQKEYDLKVCGVYQDITNGGKTAKAMLPYAQEDVLWYVINMELNENVDLTEKISQYAAGFPSAKITDMDDYVNQTFGSIISGLHIVIKLAIVTAIAIAVLITALFFKLLAAKEKTQTAVMYSMGFSSRDIRLQYITRALSVSVIGILIGIAASMTVGPLIAGSMLSGISQFHFIVNPLVSYILCPLLLFISVWVTITISSASVKKINVMTLQNGR